MAKIPSKHDPSYPATQKETIYPAKKVEKPKPPPMSSSYISRVLRPRTEGVTRGGGPYTPPGAGTLGWFPTFAG
jgi:hypothetical protein